MKMRKPPGATLGCEGVVGGLAILGPDVITRKLAPGAELALFRKQQGLESAVENK